MVRTIPRPPKDDDQYRYQEQEQVVKIELKCRVKPPKIYVLINQDHPLFIGKFLASDARYEHTEVDNRVRSIENYLETTFSASNWRVPLVGRRAFEKKVL